MDTADTGNTEGGDFVLPFLLFGASAVLHGIYSVGQALDSNRYWSDYEKNTGYKPKYPWRVGKYDYLNSAGSSFGSAGMAYRTGRKAYYYYKYR